MSTQSKQAESDDFRASRPCPLSQVSDWHLESEVVVVGSVVILLKNPPF